MTVVSVLGYVSGTALVLVCLWSVVDFLRRAGKVSELPENKPAIAVWFIYMAASLVFLGLNSSYLHRGIAIAYIALWTIGESVYLRYVDEKYSRYEEIPRLVAQMGRISVYQAVLARVRFFSVKEVVICVTGELLVAAGALLLMFG